MKKDFKGLLIDSCKKFAAKNKFCLFLSTVYIFVALTIYELLKHSGRFVSCVVSLSLLMTGFMIFSSFCPQKFDAYVYANDKSIVVEEGTAQESAYDGNSIGEKYKQKNDWNLVLINKRHQIPDDYTFTLGYFQNSYRCDERIIEPLTEMFEAAKADGINLAIRSPFREDSRQQYLFTNKTKQYINSGKSYIDAYKEASKAITLPGTSEHEIGIALDITSDEYWKLDEDFALTGAGKWLYENSYKYGFILRYPKDKEDVTGIMFEPWHFRYVGIEAAKVMKDNNLTLEEYLESL